MGESTWTIIARKMTERTLLEIRPRGVFRRGASLAAMVPVDVGLLVFAYYLVHTRWREDATAAGAAAAS